MRTYRQLLHLPAVCHCVRRIRCPLASSNVSAFDDPVAFESTYPLKSSVPVLRSEWHSKFQFYVRHWWKTETRRYDIGMHEMALLNAAHPEDGFIYELVPYVRQD